MRIFSTILLACGLALTPASAEQVARAPVVLAAPAPLSELVKRVAISNEQFTLPNGLRVVVHTDRKAPLVSVGVWYDVGSTDEPMGKSGYAHLFEHLMFYGSAHNPNDHFRPLESIGATDFNGTTSFDRTNYFQTVPTPALELALFLESDRMGWLLPALNQAKLDAQRGVVLNEKRQGDNQPYGLVWYHILSALFPPHHPMSQSTIGREADLNAASLGDARLWFQTHYGPNNAVLALAGDIDVKTARRLVERAFGDIPPGSTPPRFAGGVPRRTETTRAVMKDAIATPRHSRLWVAPPRGHGDVADLDIALSILAGSSTSRLYERLVREDRLAVGVSGSIMAQQLAGISSLSVDLAPGADKARVEAIIDEELQRMLTEGPTTDEVARVAMGAVSGTIRGLEKVGGFGGKGAALAQGLLYANDPDEYRRQLDDYAAATPESVKRAAATWLARGDHRLDVLPGERSPADSQPPPTAPRVVESEGAPAQPARLSQGLDRSKGMPPAGPATRFQLPPIERARLSNGMEVVLATVRSVPVVRMMLSFPIGIAGDNRDKPGTQGLMLGMLDEGADGKLGPVDGPEIGRRLERLGSSFSASAGLDRTRISMSALTPNLPQSLALFSDLVRHPVFPADQLERLRVQSLTALRAEASDPAGLAYRALPSLIYGPAHPYGQSFSGLGTEEGLTAANRNDLIAFHRQLSPASATLFVVGDTDMKALKPLLEQALGDWPAGTAIAEPQAPSPAPIGQGQILLIDRPGAPQSFILGGAASKLTGRDDTIALSLANDIFGGLSSSRLFQELREKRNWSYGASTGFSATRGPMPFLLSAPVETPRTADSLMAIKSLMADWRTKTPPTAEEIAAARANLIRSLPGDFETGGALLAALERNATLERPENYLETLPARIAAVPDSAIAQAPLSPIEELSFVVVGDRRLVEPQLKAAGLPYRVAPPQAPEGKSRD